MDGVDLVFEGIKQGVLNLIHSPLIWYFIGLIVLGIILFIIKRKINKK